MRNESTEGFSSERTLTINRILTACLLLLCLLVIALPALAEEEIVTTEDQANYHARVVYESVKKYGFEFKEPVVIRIANEQAMTEALHKSGAAGLSRMTYNDLPTGKKNLVSVEISIQSGFSVANFQRHLAHELCRVWIHQQGNDGLDKVFEEGSCEALSFLAVYEIGSPDSTRIMSSIENNSDTIYGVGFRYVRDFIMQHGMAEWRNRIAGHSLYIWANNDFPSTPPLNAEPIPTGISYPGNNEKTSNTANNLKASSGGESSNGVDTNIVVQDLGTVAIASDQSRGATPHMKMIIIIAMVMMLGVMSVSVWVRNFIK